MLRFFFGVLILFVLGWSAYWWIGSNAQQTRLIAWFENRHAAGWVAHYDKLNVKGYPNRFDTRITNLHLADPASGWAWTTPEFQVLMLSYKPGHIIAVWPPEQSITTPNERVAVHSNDIRASVKFDANTGLALKSATAELDRITLNSNAGWSAELGSAKLATRRVENRQDTHDLYFQAIDLKLSRKLLNSLGSDNFLLDVFDTVKIDITAGFDAPWNRRAIEGQKPELTRLEVRDINASWGDLKIQASGELMFDTGGYPTGQITVRAENWKDMLELAAGSGVIPSELHSVLEYGLGFLARLSNNRETIDAPLKFKNGMISIGLLPIGRTPQFRLNP